MVFYRTFTVIETGGRKLTVTVGVLEFPLVSGRTEGTGTAKSGVSCPQTEKDCRSQRERESPRGGMVSHSKFKESDRVSGERNGHDKGCYGVRGRWSDGPRETYLVDWRRRIRYYKSGGPGL